MRAISSWLRRSVRAFQFSSRCSGELVPGIGSIIGERASDQASATWDSGGAMGSGDLGDDRCLELRTKRHRQREEREERDPFLRAAVDQLLLAGDLHARDVEAPLAGGHVV